METILLFQMFDIKQVTWARKGQFRSEVGTKLCTNVTPVQTAKQIMEAFSHTQYQHDFLWKQ